MKTKHTPGPWTVFAGPEDAPQLTIHGTDKHSNQAPLVADVGSSEVPVCEAHANARLIAAAPCLLAALAQLERLASGLIDQSATHDGLRNCDALANARAAILKAGGAL